MSAEPPVRAVWFDLGGVFFPWPGSDFFARWEARLGLAPGELHARLWHGPDVEAANVGAITAEEYCRRCAPRLGTDPDRVRELIETAYTGEYLDAALAAYARSLRPRVRVAALTNSWSFGRDLIARSGIGDLFDLVVSSAEEGVRKPDPRIYGITLERLGIAPAEAVFVDDVEENVAAARALGIHSLLFTSTDAAVRELDALLARRGACRA